MNQVRFTLARLCLGLLVFWISQDGADAQVSISDGGTIENCETALVDTGGDNGPYGANENHTITLCPVEPDSTVWIEWVIFDLDLTSSLVIYDGSDDTAPILAQGTLGQLGGSVQVASPTNASGCLTVQFTSGAGATGDFAANVNCGQPCAVPFPVINPLTPSPHRVCPGEVIQFDGTNSTTNGEAELVTWGWDWDGDGSADEETSEGITTHVYNDPGIYRVQLYLTDAEGCESLQLTNYIVQVSTDPVWSMTSQTSCTGSDVLLSAQVEGVTFNLAPEVDFGEGLFIPDIQGECFSAEMQFNQFIPGQTIVDADATLESLFINFEHSYMGDLTVSFICPNGQSIMVHQQGGTNTFLGVPVDDDAQDDVPGVGFDYSWSPDATNGTWADNAGGTLPAGTYESVQPFSNLEGCPLNGVWQLEICDLLGSDNGFVFDWAIAFADSIYPAEMSFTPTFGLECDSTYWETDDLITNVLQDGSWDCAELTVTNETSGVQTYTAHAINNFGCEYTQEVEVEYVSFYPTIEASPEIYCGGVPVELNAVITMDGEGTSTFEWAPEIYLSNIEGATVYASGMDEPQDFTFQVTQTFDNYDGLECQGEARFTVGTCGIRIPNVISPFSSTGTNDVFQIPGVQAYEDVELTVKNRWGTTVYKSKNFGEDNPWDPKAENASSGVYYFVLTIPIEQGPIVVTDINGETQYTGEGPFTFQGMIHVVD